MNSKEEEEIKHEFQLERVILFSDAVFAIIITIMVIDIKLPESIVHADAKHIKQAIIDLLPRFTAYLLSFSLIGNFWYGHLRIFSILKNYNRGLIIINLLFLFFISLFPFSVSLVAINSQTIQFSWGFSFYFGIVASLMLIQTIMVHYLITRKSKLCIDSSDFDAILEWKVQRMNYVAFPLLCTALIILMYYSLNMIYIVFGFALYGLIISRVKKHYYPDNVNKPLISMLFGPLRKHKTP
ncbi:TMEM175 family protein [Mucilaginibacter flavus]|uniref:TMEM175 family protein n=1 Tax=Mucilaginibacter flavus TaxID=931504 RepID=UPI0025B2F99E|nr:TMEM175 family protein [Mucilaginibacter flavus]MDN3580755.1 TMEM175 family protein [Mucilaginibacter flavus]